MVDVGQLASDIVANSVALALPGLLWGFLFLLAWEHGPFAESVGFGRRAFWLLLPGSVLASFAILPFGAAANDIIGVSLGGALFPLFVGALALRRVAPPLRQTLLRYLGPLAVEGALALLVVLPLAAGLTTALGTGLGVGAQGGQDLLVGSVAVVVPLVVRLGERPEGLSGPVVRLLLPLTSAVLLLTFLASSAVPGLGIVEPFPLFLLPPIGAGAVAALVAPRALPNAEAAALPVAYVGTTWGVLLGADLLRQPPLYGSGPAGLYTIGGAGVFDLVYLSGLLALLVATLAHWALGRPLAVPGGPPSDRPGPTPVGRLGRAFRAGITGQLAESLNESATASRDAALQAHRLLGLPEPPRDRPWQGLGVPGWVVSDQTNLDALARSGTTDGREGFRGWLTARSLVRLGLELGRRRFGTVGRRAAGFLLDLGLVTAPAALIWAAIAIATPGTLLDLLNSVAFNAAIYGFIALAFFYRVILEAVTGSSPGKRALGLVVRGRRLEPIGVLSALVRNLSVLPILTVVGIGGSLAVAFGLRWGTFSSVTIGGIDLPGGLLALAGALAFVLGGIALIGVFGVVAITFTAERQRLGDLFAGTWVVRAATTATPPWGAVHPPSSGPGPGRSA